MSVFHSSSVSLLGRFRGIFAVTGVVILFGVAVVAPLAIPSASADADVLAMKKRINQEFTPNDSPDDDLVFTDVPVKKLPDPESASPAAPPRYEGGGSPADWMQAAGIGEDDWGYVDFIASRESGWNPNATNASSGACGLIQAYPCSKVPGNGYDPVDNLRWASGYAVDRYGSWAAAYAFWSSNHWW